MSAGHGPLAHRRRKKALAEVSEGLLVLRVWPGLAALEHVGELLGRDDADAELLLPQLDAFDHASSHSKGLANCSLAAASFRDRQRKLVCMSLGCSISR